MRISNIIGILGLAAMLFLIAIATGVAHADKASNMPLHMAEQDPHWCDDYNGFWQFDADFCQDDVEKILVTMEDVDGGKHAYTYDRQNGWRFVVDF